MFGTAYFGCGSFDYHQQGDREDAQALDGFPALRAPNQEDLGTAFSDIEEEDLPRPANRGGKHLRQHVLLSRDQNRMGGSSKHNRRGNKGGGAAATRSTTEGDRMKKENEQLKREIEDLKSEVQTAKKAKVVVSKKVVVEKKEWTKGVWTEIEDAFKFKVWPYIKFMNGPEDEVVVMKAALKLTSEWRVLKKIPEDQLDDHVKAYLTTYGAVLASSMNKTRSEDQSAVRTRYIKDWNNGVKISAKMHLWLMQRPEQLLILEENTDDPEVNAKNKEVNDKNKDIRDRMQHFLMNFVDKGVPRKTWSPDMQCSKTLSNYKDKEGNDVIPPESEAAILLYIENNEQKWVWQAGMAKAGVKYEQWKTANKKNKEELKQEPPTKYSSSSCGAKKYGGWNAEGRKRFMRLVKIITKARAREHTAAIEEQMREAIKVQREEEGTRKKGKKETELEVLLQDSDGSDVEFEDYDTDEEEQALEKNIYLSKKDREAKAAKAKAAEEAAQAQAKAGESDESEDEGGESATASAAKTATGAAAAGDK